MSPSADDLPSSAEISRLLDETLRELSPRPPLQRNMEKALAREQIRSADMRRALHDANIAVSAAAAQARLAHRENEELRSRNEALLKSATKAAAPRGAKARPGLRSRPRRDASGTAQLAAGSYWDWMDSPLKKRAASPSARVAARALTRLVRANHRAALRLAFAALRGGHERDRTRGAPPAPPLPSAAAERLARRALAAARAAGEEPRRGARPPRTDVRGVLRGAEAQRRLAQRAERSVESALAAGVCGAPGGRAGGPSSPAAALFAAAAWLVPFLFLAAPLAQPRVGP